MEHFEEIEKKIVWGQNFNKLIKSLDNNNDISFFPKEKDEIDFYIKNFESFMDHNEEKYRDREGKEFFERIKEFIEKIQK